MLFFDLLSLQIQSFDVSYLGIYADVQLLNFFVQFFFQSHLPGNLILLDLELLLELYLDKQGINKLTSELQ